MKVVPELKTRRLIVSSLTLEMVHAAMSDRDLLGRLLEADIPDDWPNSEFASFLPVLAQDLLREPGLGEWMGLVIQQREPVLVGDIGFKGLPDAEGTVEIGYSIVPDYQGRGFATEATQAMVGWAFEHQSVERVTANCLNDNQASIRVLQKVGMKQIGRNGPLLDWSLEQPERKR
jgi:[ribosomal protein S5]-alanine N-acetyltransferase